jgi:fermentation-respiration switch protein FrsA (DUF1100 family)
MTKGLTITLVSILVVILAIFIGLNIMTRSLARDIIQHPMQERIDAELWPPDQTPADFGRDYEEVETTSEDGLKLTGWFLPGDNGATIMIYHGSPGGRQDGLYEAAFLNEAGFTVLLGSFRAHDDCEGDLITFGYYEIQDIEAWHNFLLSRDDVDSTRIGLFGESMGGGTSILYAAKNSGIRAIATGSAFGLTQQVVEKFVEFETGLPAPLIPILARFIIFWAEQIGNTNSEELYTQGVVADISPVPILIIHGGQDDKIGPDIGRELYEAAAEPKELLWLEEAGHVWFEDQYPEKYKTVLLEFFEKYLLD